MTWRGKRVSVVFPRHNDQSSVRACILDFASTEVIDEIIVFKDKAAKGTDERLAALLGDLPTEIDVREVYEPYDGYGPAIRRGLQEASGDYIAICEPDGSFIGRDIFKLLAYIEDFDAVYGSRTASTVIWQGAKMRMLQRWGSWSIAKLLEFLFNGTNFTDVGCTVNVIRRDAIDELHSEFAVGGNAVGFEMMLQSLLHGLRVIQVPVKQSRRTDVTSVRGDLCRAVALGVWMMVLTIRGRVRMRSTRLRNSSGLMMSGGGRTGEYPGAETRYVGEPTD